MKGLENREKRVWMKRMRRKSLSVEFKRDFPLVQCIHEQSNKCALLSSSFR